MTASKKKAVTTDGNKPIKEKSAEELHAHMSKMWAARKKKAARRRNAKKAWTPERRIQQGIAVRAANLRKKEMVQQAYLDEILRVMQEEVVRHQNRVESDPEYWRSYGKPLARIGLFAASIAVAGVLLVVL